MVANSGCCEGLLLWKPEPELSPLMVLLGINVMILRGFSPPHSSRVEHVGEVGVKIGSLESRKENPIPLRVWVPKG